MNPIVVLGSRVINGRPGPMLEQRLLKAQRIAQPGQEIIVSGHLEARAMRDFLLRPGLNRVGYHVVEELHATSTNENLENARKLRPHAPGFTVVTSNFHVLRTRMWAWHLGMEVDMVSAPTPAGYRTYNYVRELLATPHSAARILVRKVLKRLPWGHDY